MCQRNSCAIIISASFLALIIGLGGWVRHESHKHSIDRSLIEAIKRSDSSQVVTLLAGGANPNTLDTPETHHNYLQEIHDFLYPPSPKPAQSALLVALYQYLDSGTLPTETPAIAKALLSKGANPNARDQYGNTALTSLYSLGISADPTQLAEILLSAGADTEAKGPDGVTPLWDAALRNFAGSVRLLLEHGASAQSTDEDGVTPLMVASSNRQTHIVNMMLEHGAKIEAEDVVGKTALMRACEYHCTNVVRTLLAHGAKTDATRNPDVTPLGIAESKGYTDIVEMLKTHGAKW